MLVAQAVWTALLDRYTHLQIEFVGYLAVQLGFFWLPSTIYILLPYVLPNFAARMKLQKQEKQPTMAEIRECVTVVLRNQALLTASHFIMLSLGLPSPFRFDAELPSWTAMKRDLFICVIGREVLFYYIHCALHLPSLYAKIHKKHHRFTAPVALAAQYVFFPLHFCNNCSLDRIIVTPL
jgi:sterol desaturase/sphingolipid hydroxylase (fatty acid hydroxylase superfamily)